MSDIAELKRKIFTRKSELEQIVKEKIHKHARVDTRINFDLSSSKTLGKSQFFNFVSPYHVISLNAKLLLEFGDLYINEVFVHEYAHAVVAEYISGTSKTNFKKVKPHGQEFKEVCSWFGIVGKSTTSLFSKSETLNIEKRRQKKWTYSCSCREHNITTTKHNKILRGAQYNCKICKEAIKLVS